MIRAGPGRPIRVLYIANRGEIAARITRSARALGIEAVTAALNGPHAVDLLDPSVVVAAATAAGADALHPGYGFLSENAAFAEAVEAAGIRWVGPPASAIRAMGDKAAARRLAASLGVPTLPGYDDPDQSDAALVEAARRLGLPLLVKPSAGGGGKGMRVVRSFETLVGALAGARREAKASFKDDRLILERFVEGPRHVEIQVLFDRHGHGVHLGERDCSLQRRHQKVLEESPSPAVDADLRERMGAAALRLASTVGYASTGTVEFLLDDHGTFSFLEMNTRLQVEHPVTEAVTGRDLVADQLRIAEGRPLGTAQAELLLTGHAVEVRLYAEDAETGFLPATGRVAAIRWPTGDGIRVDAGIAAGDEITGRFDPMLAKIIAWGDRRNEAFDRLAAALEETLVLGVVTNLRFLRWVIRQPVVRDGQVRIDSLDRIWPPADWAAATAVPGELWSIAAARFGAVEPDPWAGGWRVNATPVIRLVSDGVERAVRTGARSADTMAESGSSGAAVAPAGAAVAAAGAMTAGAGAAVAGAGASIGDADGRPSVLVDGTLFVDFNGRSIPFRLAPAPDIDAPHRSSGAGGVVDSDVTAPMPGAVLAVHVVLGAAVEGGEPLVTLEAMKMEHVVAAPLAGTVADLFVAPGDQVARGQILAVVRAGE